MPDPSESQAPEDKTASGVIEDAPTLEAEAADPTQDTQDVQEQLEESERKEPQKYGAFAGVFIPTLLTILGVILFVRQGWVVGNAGLLGAGLVIILSFGITAFTGLSMSCFVSNVRVRGGGEYPIRPIARYSFASIITDRQIGCLIAESHTGTVSWPR